MKETRYGAACHVLAFPVLSLAIAVGVAYAPASAAGPRTFAGVLGGRVIAAEAPLRGVRDLGRAPQTLPISLALTLTYRHDGDLQRLIELQGDPRSQYYHRFLSNAQFADYFGPRAVDEQHVVDALSRAGFTITQRRANRTVVDAVVPAAAAERYFSTEMHRFAQPGAGLRYANVRPALMPQELSATVAAVVGLSNVIRIHPDLTIATPAQKVRAKARALAMSDGNGARLVGTRIAGWHLPPEAADTKAATRNVLADEGFESGRFGAWQQFAELSHAVIAEVRSHSGKYSAFFGSKTPASGEINGDSGLVQALTIPANRVLSFWALQGSNESSPKTSWQEADLLDDTGRHRQLLRDGKINEWCLETVYVHSRSASRSACLSVFRSPWERRSASSDVPVHR